MEKRIEEKTQVNGNEKASNETGKTTNGKAPKAIPKLQNGNAQKVEKASPKTVKQPPKRTSPQKRGKQTRLTEEQVREIKRLGREGKLSQKEIRDKLAPGYELGNVSRILSGKLWANIK